MSWLPKKCVVVPVDYSDPSFEAIDTALNLVDAPSSIRVLHVLPVLEATEPGVIWDTIDDNSRRTHAAEAIKKRLDDPKYQGAHVEVVFGEPGHEIAEYAKEQKAELVVLPSHGRTGLARLLIGSTAERVVRLSHCPVLVLRT